MSETTSIGVSRRALSLAAAGGLALAGTITLVTGQTAQAEVMEQGDKVWVCKFVGKPYESELLKGGKNPIEVGWQSADKDKDGNVSVGDEFADGQGMSVVVQINGDDPGVEACMPPTPPPTNGTTTQPTTGTTATHTTGTTTTGTTTSATTGTTSPGTTTQPPATTPAPPATTGGAGGGVTPGVGAPDTGGTEGVPVSALMGSGFLLAAGAVVAAEALRRRRELSEG